MIRVVAKTMIGLALFALVAGLAMLTNGMIFLVIVVLALAWMAGELLTDLFGINDDDDADDDWLKPERPNPSA